MESTQSIVLVGVALLSMLLLAINHRLNAPALAIINRWIRWLFFGFGGAFLIKDFEVGSQPYWVLVVVLLLVWFLGETLYNWLAISALSQSPVPLFPPYESNKTGEDWPIDPRQLRVREWLRQNHFRQAQTLVADIGGQQPLRLTIYQNLGGTLRIQVSFFPQPNGSFMHCCAISTQMASGKCLQTDNLCVPFGGFYPENWDVDRRLLCRSIAKLLRIHEARVSKSGETPEPFTGEPLLQIKKQQSELEAVNIGMGFLHPHSEHEEWGRITWEGRYRIWKEIWLISYLGLTLGYRS